MFLSKRPNGFYYLWYVDELGRKRKISTKCRYKAEAIKFFQSFKQQEQERKNNLQRISLSEFSKAYLEYSRSVHTIKTTESSETALREFLRVIGDLPLHKVGVREIETFLAAKKEEASAWTSRKYYIALASAFETAKRWGHVLANPFREVAKPRVPEIQPVFFSRSDFGLLLKAIEDRDLRELVLTALSTGMRLGELLSLEWQAVDFSRRVIGVRNSEGFTTKNKRNRVVPMNDSVTAVLLSRRERAPTDAGLVFQKGGKKLKPKAVSIAFKKRVLDAKLDERLHFHSLRHTFASWLVQDGVSLYEVQKLLGHSSIVVTQVYSHLQPEQLHSTVNRIEVSLN